MTEPLRFTLFISPTTKKTSNEVVYKGTRCPSCRRGVLPIVLPAANYRAFEKACAPGMQRKYSSLFPRREIADCGVCKGTGIKQKKACIGCGGRGKRTLPMEGAVLVEAIFYREANRGDLSGYLEAVGDLLQTAGVIGNDRQIQGWPLPADGRLPLRKDPQNPRVEIVITPIAVVLELPLDLAPPTAAPPPAHAPEIA